MLRTQIFSYLKEINILLYYIYYCQFIVFLVNRNCLFSGVIWSREEALSSVLVAEAVDLPVAGAEVNYQDQMSLRSGKDYC